jgi:hypothetical protein
MKSSTFLSKRGVLVTRLEIVPAVTVNSLNYHAYTFGTFHSIESFLTRHIVGSTELKAIGHRYAISCSPRHRPALPVRFMFK